MSRPTLYTQVRLQRGITQLVTWIPSIYAARNRYLRLRMNGAWEDGWRVMSCGAEQSEEYVAAYERDYRTQREASDI